jgi:hypothetical protein
VPITGTGTVLGDAMHTAREALLATFFAHHPVPTGPDYAELRRQMTRSDAQVILAHLTANGLVTVAVVGASGTGTIT